MFTKQKISKDVWLVHYEAIMERYSKTFTSEEQADNYIKNQLK